MVDIRDDVPINEYLAYLLAQADRQISRQLEAELRSEGVPLEQWRILKTLADGNGRSMGDLADTVLMNHPTLTKTVDRMVSSALVYRVADPADRRKVMIFLSDRGRALSERLDRLVADHQANLVESWGDEHTSQLKRLLEGLIERTA